MDAERLRRDYSMELLAFDNQEKYFGSFAGRYAVWVEDGTSDGIDYSGIWGYDTTTNKIVTISNMSDRFESRPEPAATGVAFKVQSLQSNGAPAGNGKLWIWKPGAAARPIGETIGGAHELFGFDGTWVIYAANGSPNSTENAFWATNIETLENVLVYRPVMPRGLRPDGAHEFFGTAIVWKHRVYYDVAVTTGANHTDRTTTIYELDLDRRSTRVVHVGPESVSGRMAVSDHWLAFPMSTDGYHGTAAAVDIRTGDIQLLAKTGPTASGVTMAVEGNLIAYDARPFPESTFAGVYIVNMTTGARQAFEPRTLKDVSHEVMDMQDGKVLIRCWLGDTFNVPMNQICMGDIKV